MNQVTQLLRQVHPNHFKEGFPSSQAFFPNPRDMGFLSVYDGDMISAVKSYSHYTGVSKLQSAGVWAVMVEEVDVVGLRARPDPAPYPEHAVIDFTERPEKEWRKYAKLLVEFANLRGCLYQP